MRCSRACTILPAVAVVAAALAIVLTAGAIRAVPQYINYQGYLTDSGGTPLNETASVELTLYDAETAGTVLWSESHATVEVADGLFHVLIGEVTVLDLALFDSDTLWLEVAVNGETLTPRKRLTSVGYAVRSATADTVGTPLALSGSAADPVLGAANSGAGDGLFGETAGTSAAGVYGAATAATGANYGVYGESLSAGGTGIYGRATDGTGTTFGVKGESLSTSGTGVHGAGELTGVSGEDTDGSGVGRLGYSDTGVFGSGSFTGVYGEDSDHSGFGQLGYANYGVWGSGSFAGVHGEDSGTASYGRLGFADYGVYGSGSSTGVFGSGSTAGVEGQDSDGSGFGRLGMGNFGLFASGNAVGVQGEDSGTNSYGRLGWEDYGVYGNATVTPTGDGVYGVGTESGVHGEDSGTASYGRLGFADYGVYGDATATAAGYGVYGVGTESGVYGHDSGTGSYGRLGYDVYGVWGQNTSTSAGWDRVGVYGEATGASYGYGVYGVGKHTGVYGKDSEDSGFGRLGSGDTGVSGFGSWNGVFGKDSDDGTYGRLGYGSYAGYFSGDAHVTGELTAGTKTFVQPHAEEPGKEIQYAVFEGPEHAVFVRGTARLEAGQAVVELPHHFRVVAAEEGIEVHVTPYSADTRGLAVVERSRERIVVRELAGGAGSFEFGYFVTGVRAGFEEHQPVVENTHFRPRDDETVEDFERRFQRDDMGTRAMLRMMVANGLFTADGRLDMDTVRELGWEVAEADESGPPADRAPEAPPVAEHRPRR